jgi:vacuolar-type H+-ATPase subunit E/Vma4
MPLEELQKSIEQEAKAAASKLQEEGDGESERILAAAKQAAAALKRSAKEKAVSEVTQRERDMLTEIENDTQSILSAAKEEAISKYVKPFDAAVRKKLQAKQKDMIKAALKNFSDVAPLRQASVKISKKNAALVEGLVANIEYADIDGIIVSSADKKITADATVDGLVESNADVARRILARGMFK